MKNKTGEVKITKLSKVNRMPKRGFYDFETIYKILDGSFVCHIGFVFENHPVIIPVAFGRKENEIFFHGAKASRLFNSLRSGIEVCITVTIADGLVLARSAFHHSMNYRSVIMFGKTEEISIESEKSQALKNILEHLIPGRWDDVREPNKKELNATSVFKFEIDEASAKIRTGPPVDDEEDMQMNVWAGILPLKTVAGKPVQDQLQKDKVNLPQYIRNYKLK